MKFLKRLAAAACSILTASCSYEAAPGASSEAVAQKEFDILITGGRAIIGDGAPAVEADIGVVGDTITEIGRLSGRSAATVIDADGLIVAPGFIDMHTHVDDAFGDPALSPVLNYLFQGVTTVRPGADGFGSYDIAGTKQAWESNGMGTNAVMFAPHRVIRNTVMSDDQLRAPTAEELAAMVALVEKAMQEGAWGVSAQLEYGGYETYVTTEEMIAFSRPVADFGGFYVSHIRNEASGILDAINETIEIGAAIGTRTSVTHLKATGRDNWGLMKDAVALINDARARGVDIVADQYPFLQGAPIDYVTALIDIPPTMEELYALSMQLGEPDMGIADQEGAREKFVVKLQAALRDPEMREQLKQSTYEQRQENPSYAARWGWQDFRIKVAVENAHYLEKNIAEIMDEENRDGFDIVADLVLFGTLRSLRLSVPVAGGHASRHGAGLGDDFQRRHLCAGDRGRRTAGPRPSALFRKSGDRSAQICARGRIADAGGCGAQDDVPARIAPRHDRPRPSAGRIQGRHCHFRS